MANAKVYQGVDWSSTGRKLAWTPAMLPGIAVWFRADSNVVTASGRLTQITDKVHGVVLSSPSGSQPVYLSAVSAANMQPGFGPDSVPKYLAFNGVEPLTAYEYNQAFSYGLVFNHVAGGGASRLLFGNHQPAAPYAGWWVGSTPVSGTDRLQVALSAGTAGATSFTGTTPLVAGNTYYVVVSCDGTGTASGITVSINGISEAASSTGNTLGSNSLMGSDHRLMFYTTTSGEASGSLLFEAFASSGVISSGSLAQANAYFSNRY